MFFRLHSHRQSSPLFHGGVTLILVALSAFLIHAAHSYATGTMPYHLVDHRVAGGSLVIAGGGYVSPEVRARFVELAGGPNAQIVVIPATDPDPGDEDKWLAPWRGVGALHVQFCNAHDRATANSKQFCANLARATGVWFSGGYQAILADRYVDTAVQKCLHDVLRRNGVVGGCSAGAAILSRIMIKEGEVTPVEARGLDLISDAIVDQHFLQRNRLWRMQQVLEAHPTSIGLGIDENTALIVEVASWRLKVLGESYAMVCLPSAEGRSSRIEVLKAGECVLLSQLRKDHLAYQSPVQVDKPLIQVSALHSA